MNFIKLKNIGNTCYFNSCFQLFLNSPIINGNIKNHCNCDNKFCSYYKQFLNNNTTENLICVMKILGCKNIQMDSYEFILKIIDSLDTCDNNVKDLYTTKYTIQNDLNVTTGKVELSHFITFGSIREIVYNKNINIIQYPMYLIIYIHKEKKIYNTIKITSKIDSHNIKYKLEKLLCFVGGDNSGHYFTLIKAHDIWYKIDDDNINILTEQMYIFYLKYSVLCMYTKYIE